LMISLIKAGIKVMESLHRGLSKATKTAIRMQRTLHHLRE